MKNKILIVIFSLLALLIWSCNEEPLVGPETSNEQEALQKLTVGETNTILSMEYGTFIESIAFDRMGNMYVSRTVGNTTDIILVKDGSYKVFATLPGVGKAVGLIVDRAFNVYMAYHSTDPNINGVYKIRKNGKYKKLPGSSEINYPNALAFDLLGNLYVTDYWVGAIWKYEKCKKFNLWFEHDYLKPYPFDPFPMPQGGANGIAFYPPNILYVANTEKSNISKIEIMPNGKAGNITQLTPELISGGQLISLDGIAVAASGNIYGVLPASTLIGMPSLWKVDPNNGSCMPMVPPDPAHFDSPTSLAFGTRGLEKRATIYIVNSDLFKDPTSGSGAGVVKVFVGEFGLPIR